MIRIKNRRKYPQVPCDHQAKFPRSFWIKKDILLTWLAGNYQKKNPQNPTRNILLNCAQVIDMILCNSTLSNKIHIKLKINKAFSRRREEEELSGKTPVFGKQPTQQIPRTKIIQMWRKQSTQQNWTMHSFLHHFLPIQTDTKSSKTGKKPKTVDGEKKRKL